MRLPGISNTEKLGPQGRGRTQCFWIQERRECSVWEVGLQVSGTELLLEAVSVRRGRNLVFNPNLFPVMPFGQTQPEDRQWGSPGEVVLRGQVLDHRAG